MATPGQLERYDCEYRRNGTANLFVFLDAHRPWRTVKVTDRRTTRDFAQCMRDLVDLHYSGAELIRVVLDTLSTHSPGALYEAFPAPRRTASCVAWSSTTPQNKPLGSTWFEIKISVLRSQCLDRRIGDRKTHEAEIDVWQRHRNATSARIKWMFTTQRARIKLLRAYPDPAKES